MCVTLWAGDQRQKSYLLPSIDELNKEIERATSCTKHPSYQDVKVWLILEICSRFPHRTHEIKLHFFCHWKTVWLFSRRLIVTLNFTVPSGRENILWKRGDGNLIYILWEDCSLGSVGVVQSHRTGKIIYTLWSYTLLNFPSIKITQI